MRKPAIVTSATLAAEQRFDFLARRLGLDEAIEEAELMAEDFGLIVRAIPVQTDQALPDTVLSQEPPPGQTVEIGSTITDPAHPEPLAGIAVEEPTMSVDFMVNTSPFAGRSGKYVTGRQVRERLHRELERNVALRVPVSDAQNLRIEHRSSGADANPYLVTAAVLAGVHFGLKNRCDPGRMVQEGEVIMDSAMMPEPLPTPGGETIFEDGHTMHHPGVVNGGAYHGHGGGCNDAPNHGRGILPPLRAD